MTDRTIDRVWIAGCIVGAAVSAQYAIQGSISALTTTAACVGVAAWIARTGKCGAVTRGRVDD